ncbi:hypothetical protein QUB75_14630 [Microcoleus sp. K1-B6]|uniref:hypothetical protein n=1 Tax=unclassified Microcoleus TaxID=2642155 RepID=UPI002FD6EEBF
MPRISDFSPLRMFPHAPGIIYGRAPPSPKRSSLTIDITPKSTQEDDRTQASYEHGRSGKLERSIAAYACTEESNPNRCMRVENYN